MSVIATPRLGMGWFDSLFAGRRKVEGRRLRVAGKRTRCQTACCGTDDCSECLEIATALDVNFNWFVGGSLTGGNVALCTDFARECTDTNLNTSFTLLRTGGSSSGNTHTASFAIELGDPTVCEDGVQLWQQIGHQKIGGGPCCDLHYIASVWRIRTILSVNCNNAIFSSPFVSVSFVLDVALARLLRSGGAQCVTDCDSDIFETVSCGGNSAVGGWAQLCLGQTVSLTGRRTGLNDCNITAPLGPATISLVF